MAEPEFLARVRRSYDAVAADLAKSNAPGLAERHPLERAVLDAFAELVRDGQARPVADLGCGSGSVTAYLRDRGLDVFGLDLSPRLVTEARRAHPGLSFEVGSMTDVDRPDGSLDGIVAVYSMIHLPSDRLPQLYREFHRLLAPGGRLLLVFQVRSAARELTSWFDTDVDLTYPPLLLDDVVTGLTATGFTVEASIRREPNGAHESLPRGTVLAARENVGGRG